MGGRIVTCLAVGIVLVAAPAAEAQGVAYTFTELRLLVRPGETISVVDAAGREMTGRIVELWPSKLALRRAAGTHEVLERDVQTIWQRRGDSLRNGALWGLGSGAALGGLAALAMLGVFPVDELLTLKKIGSRLQGHPAMHYTPGLEA